MNKNNPWCKNESCEVCKMSNSELALAKFNIIIDRYIVCKRCHRLTDRKSIFIDDICSVCYRGFNIDT